MRNILLAATVVFGLLGCDNSTNGGSPSSQSALSANTSWPMEVSGTVDIVDAGAGESDYATWAIGSITVSGEDISIEFEQSVLRDAGINLDFEFSDPATLILGKPKEEYGVLTYPVKQVK